MLEVVDEGFAPIVVFDGACGDGVNLVLLRDELQHRGKQPPLLDGNLRGLTLRKGECRCKFGQRISWSVPASWDMKNFNMFEFIHELPGHLTVRHKLRFANLIYPIDLSNNQLRVPINP